MLRAVLVGYLGNPGQAEVLARWTQALQAARADLRVVIDKLDARRAQVFIESLILEMGEMLDEKGDDSETAGPGASTVIPFRRGRPR